MVLVDPVQRVSQQQVQPAPVVQPVAASNNAELSLMQQQLNAIIARLPPQQVTVAPAPAAAPAPAPAAPTKQHP